MRIKRRALLTLALLYVTTLMMSVNATTPVPVLISVEVEDIRGEFVDYTEGRLTVTVEGLAVTIAVMHDADVDQVEEVTETTYGAQFKKMQPGTLLDMKVTKAYETSYILESLVSIHQQFSSESPSPVLISTPVHYEKQFNGFEIVFREAVIAMDTQAQVIDDRVMIPLRFVAESLGYEVSWNGESQSVDLMKGPHFTSITISRNSYFKNKMAPRILSAEPVIVDSRTMVPIEFITEILGFGVEFKDNQLKIHDEPFTTLTGYITEMTELDDYTMVYVAPGIGEDVEMWEQTVLIVSDNTIINRAPLAVGELIKGVHLPMMTMSIPGQTNAVVIY